MNQTMFLRLGEGTVCRFIDINRFVLHLHSTVQVPSHTLDQILPNEAICVQESGGRLPGHHNDQSTTPFIAIAGVFSDLAHATTSRESKSLPRATFRHIQIARGWSDLDGIFGGVFQTIRRVDVDLGRRDILMPECVTYLFYGGTVLKGHCGKGMPQ